VAKAWKNGEALLNGLAAYPESVKRAEFKRVTDSDRIYDHDQFHVNQVYNFSGKLVPGMNSGEDYDLVDGIGVKEYNKLISLAASRGLIVEEKPDGFYLSKPDRSEQAFVSKNDFSATTPELFEAIGKEIYELSTGEEEPEAEEESSEDIEPKEVHSPQEQIPFAGEKPKSRWPWSRKHETV
jgi:hypothetical protein